MSDAPEQVDDPTPDQPGAQSTLGRRAFLAAGIGAAGVSAVSFYWCEDLGKPERRAQIDPTPEGEPGRTFDAAMMATATAACERLLPSSEGSPGAREVGAARYLDALLATDEVTPEKRAIVVDGLAKLDVRAKRAGLPSFAAGTVAQQDGMIRVFETYQVKGSYPGHPWLRMMLRYILEAFLGDPVHGGNPGQIGWKWIGHDAPAVRPTTPGWKPTPRDP